MAIFNLYIRDDISQTVRKTAMVITNHQ